jgi:hypothetical protein
MLAHFTIPGMIEGSKHETSSSSTPELSMRAMQLISRESFLWSHPSLEKGRLGGVCSDFLTGKKKYIILSLL